MSGFEEIADSVPRDRFGRPMIIPPEGGKQTPYTRATTLAGAIEDTYNLGQWQQRMVAAGLARRKDLHLRAASLGLQPDTDPEKRKWKTAMDEVTEAAKEAAQASSSAITGTALHSFTEAVDLGHDIEIPDEIAKHITSYRDATAQVTALHVEQFLVVDELKVGGTADRIVRIDGHDGLYIADIKTGSVEYGVQKMCMQLALYAHGQRYNPATGERHPIPGINTDRGLIIHLDAKSGDCRLLWIDIAAGWEAVRLAGEVRAWRARKDLAQPWQPNAAHIPTPKTVAERTASSIAAIETQRRTAAIENAIAAARTAEELTQIWTEASRAGAWTQALTELAAARKQAVTAA